eukprot:g8013.t1
MAIPTYQFTVREGAERQEDVKQVAKSVMQGAWLEFPSEEIAVTVIGGGITNLLFKLQGPKEEAAILVRIYGEDTDVLIDRERDNALFDELARMGYAPPFHGRFRNGRIEGFLPARALEPQEMSKRAPVDFVSLIAKEMSRLHGLPVTTAGKPEEAEIWRVLPEWLEKAKGLTFEDEAKAAAIKSLDLDWICQEVEWLREQLCRTAVVSEGEAGTPICNGSSTTKERAKDFLAEVVLCHNDLLSGNVLYADGWDRVQVIDFEYSGYNPRAFDIANHFCEHAGFDSDFAKSYPTPDTQAAFLTSYVRAVTAQEPVDAAVEPRAGGTPIPMPTPPPASDEEESFVEALRVEVNKWALPSHLWWTAWAVVQARYSPIDFDFVDYARLRMAGYRLHKEEFFGVKREREPSEEDFKVKGLKPS